jgi:hypothetical protein
MPNGKNKSKQLADQLFPERRVSDELAILDIPPEQRRLHTETYDFSVATIHEYLGNGNIFIPRFQRSYVWNRAQASRLIESLVIQCPIPVIYLNQEKDEKLSVIDGNQRLQSIKLYLDGEFQLRGLTTYPELEGYEFGQLDPRIQRHIQNRTLRCIAILKDTHPQIKFDVFERLNTGAVQLNAQEIRHGIYHGALIELVDQLAEDPLWLKLGGFASDRRMRGAELVLRFIALYADLDNYQKPLSGFMNTFCETHQNASINLLNRWKSQFHATVGRTTDFLGDLAFRTFDETGRMNKNINAALFDAQMVGIATSSQELKKLRKKDLVRHLRQLYQEPEFNEAITSGTSATNLVKYRIKRFKTFLESLAS